MVSIFLRRSFTEFCNLPTFSKLFSDSERQIEHSQILILCASTTDGRNDAVPSTSRYRGCFLDCIYKGQIRVLASSKGGVRIAKNTFMLTKVDHQTYKPLVLSEYPPESLNLLFIRLCLPLMMDVPMERRI